MALTLTKVGSNQTVLTLTNDTQVFFSYNTPVAAFVPSHGYCRTSTYYSRTTSKHITQWAGKHATVVDQAEIDALVA